MPETQRIIRGVASLFGLAAMLIGLPVALSILVGWPLPSDFSSVGDALTEQMSDETLNKILACVCWVLWAQFVCSVTTEAVAWRRHSAARRIPLGRNTQAFARHLVLAAVLLFTSTQKQAPATIELRSVVPAVALTEPSTAQTSVQVVKEAPSVVPATKSYVVKPRDDLWTLAERHLGDGQRWREIFDLNKGKLQPHNRSLQDPGLIRPGWTLQLPANAAGLDDDPHEVVIDTPAVEPVPTPPPLVSTPSVPTANEAVTTTTTTPPTSEAVSEEVASTSLSRVALLGGGISAAGVLGLLIQLRRVQQRRRPIGTRIAPPNGLVQESERTLRIAADAPAAERLDVALRALSCCLSQHDFDDAPRISAVRAHSSGVEILFDRPVDQPSGPFELRAGGQAWWLDADVHEIRIGALATDVVAPIPALVSAGTIDGATVLVDLEAARTTSINSNSDTARAMLHAMALEASTSQWADYLNVVVIGDASTLSSLDRVRSYDSLSEALDDLALEAKSLDANLDGAGHSTALRGRLVNGTTEGWVPTVVFIEKPQDDQSMARLDELITEAGRGIAAVAINWSDAERTIDIKGSHVEITPPSIIVDAPVFSEDESRSLDALLQDALDEPTYVPAASNEMTVVDVREPETEDLDPAFEVLVEILGPVRISGNKQPFKRKRAVEVVAYLATHPNGVDGPRLMDAVWFDMVPTRNTFNSTVSYARGCLGKASDNEDHLLSSQNGSDYRLHTTVGTDFAVFESLAARARSTSHARSIELLTQALSYVRDMPFAMSGDGYEWAHSEGIITHITAVVADAACQLAELALETGDNDKARWAASQGLLISPGFEPLYCAKMRAFANEGNTSGVDAVMTELRHALDLVEPYDGLMPETLAVYESLRGKKKVRS